MNAGRTKPRPALPRWLWLWFPPLLLLLILPVRALSPELYAQWIDGELGLIELATPVLALLGAGIGLGLSLQLTQPDKRVLRTWVVIMTVACVYFAGEEISWGQHLFGWGTPEAIDRLNDQHETNLHNMSSWFDQKPRLLLELWVLVGGIFVACGRGAELPVDPARPGTWFWPTVDCLPTAVLAIGIRMPERFKTILDLEALSFDLRWSEPQEYYFALFLMLYLASLKARLRVATDGPSRD